MSGFRKTGIHPFNPSEVLKKIPEWHDQLKEAETVDQTVLIFLKEMRYGTINVVVPKKGESFKFRQERVYYVRVMMTVLTLIQNT